MYERWTRAHVLAPAKSVRTHPPSDSSVESQKSALQTSLFRPSPLPGSAKNFPLALKFHFRSKNTEVSLYF